VAEDIQKIHRVWQQYTAGKDLVEFVAPAPFTANDPTKIYDDRIDESRIWMLFEKLL
jgi:hypothetical protein